MYTLLAISRIASYAIYLDKREIFNRLKLKKSNLQLQLVRNVRVVNVKYWNTFLTACQNGEPGNPDSCLPQFAYKLWQKSEKNSIYLN